MLHAVVTAPTVRILYNSSMSNYSSSGSHPVAEDSVTIWDNQDIVKTTWGFDRFVVPADNAKLLHCRGEFLYRANGLESGRVHLVCCCYVSLYNNLNRRDAWGLSNLIKTFWWLLGSLMWLGPRKQNTTIARWDNGWAYRRRCPSISPQDGSVAVTTLGLHSATLIDSVSNNCCMQFAWMVICFGNGSLLQRSAIA